MKKWLSILLLLCVLWASPTSAQIFINRAYNLIIGMWKLDGDGIDSSVNGLDGVLTGTTPTTDRNGTADSAVLFNGTTDKITVADDPLLDLSAQEFTIAGWVKTVGGSTDGEIFSKNKDGGCGVTISDADGTARALCGGDNIMNGGGAGDIDVDDSFIYYANSTDGAVRKISKSNYTLQASISISNIRYLALDENYVYATTNSTVYKLNKTDLSIADSVSSAGVYYPQDIEVDTNYIYFVNDSATVGIDLSAIIKLNKSDLTYVGEVSLYQTADALERDIYRRVLYLYDGYLYTTTS